MIFGSDGVDWLEAKCNEAAGPTVEVNVRTMRAMIAYYRELTNLCHHEWNCSSPIDTVDLCTKCGLLERPEKHRGFPDLFPRRGII